jgi:hypothetical protein
MQMIVKDGVKYRPHKYRNENELEDVFRKNVDIIFGNSSLFFDKTKIKSSSGIGSIPDGFVLLLDDEKWYIIEVELATHPLYDHIVPQISKFNSAIKNHATRKKLIDAFYEQINANTQLSYKFKSMGAEKELYKVLTDIIEKKPEIVIVIDEKTDVLEEICSDLPFTIKVLEFKTYCRGWVDLSTSIYLFDTLSSQELVPLNKYGEKLPIDAEEVNIIKPSRGAKTLKHVLDVAELALYEGKDYTESTRIVAEREGIGHTTTQDQCTRRIDKTAIEFRELLKDKEKLISFLKEKFPADKEVITNRLRG